MLSMSSAPILALVEFHSASREDGKGSIFILFSCCRRRTIELGSKCCGLVVPVLLYISVVQDNLILLCEIFGDVCDAGQATRA